MHLPCNSPSATAADEQLVPMFCKSGPWAHKFISASQNRSSSQPISSARDNMCVGRRTQSVAAQTSVKRNPMRTLFPVLFAAALLNSAFAQDEGPEPRPSAASQRYHEYRVVETEPSFGLAK